MDSATIAIQFRDDQTPKECRIELAHLPTGEWRVMRYYGAQFGGDGSCDIAIFGGPRAKETAFDYCEHLHRDTGIALPETYSIPFANRGGVA